MMLTHGRKWSHPPGNPVVPSGWQATAVHFDQDRSKPLPRRSWQQVTPVSRRVQVCQPQRSP